MEKVWVIAECRIQNAELICCSFACGVTGANHNSENFICLFENGFDKIFFEQSRFNNEIEPESRFISFLYNNTQFCNEFSS